ncbi:short subunit dehydrogenase [Kineococcus xinjiangensis]|uniref:Short subunit dehydrogenase n=1 Tax=Kineococcus xinjiangensis TaxID=512762 RepID=A0A2S6IWM3_9ACTN|nr:SDR family NAD(P)-dependent oxidoreductase [Kineococcus xinjiangensis]PPK98640.1 short subunit dehydrogenase [Kineococcus xinjiangensis]
MAARGKGRILVTSSIAARIPSAHQAFCSGSKAFVHAFARSIGAEPEQAGVTVTAFMPRPTHSEFFDRADLTDSALGATERTDDAAQAAGQAVEALLAGEDHVVTGALTTEVSAAPGVLTPGRTGARARGRTARPGTAG